MVTAAYLEFPVFDSNDRPTDFKDGLPTYANVTIDYGQGNVGKPLELFLLCTTCTISYVFGKPDDFASITYVNSEKMVFKSGGEEVVVDFYTTELTMNAVNMTDNSETPYAWKMSIGYISPEYQSIAYFDNF